MGLILLLSMVGTVGAVAVFARYLTRTGRDLQRMESAARQRMLALDLRAWVLMVEAGQEDDRRGLAERTADFDAGLREAQTDAARPRGTAAAPEDLRAALAAERAAWESLRPSLAARASGRGPAPLRRPAAPGLAELRDRTQRVIDVVLASAERERERAVRQVLFLLAASGTLGLTGLLLARRYILQPVLDLESVARRIGGGDFGARLDASSGDELALLAEEFNVMAGKVQELLRAVDLRRAQAETIIAAVPAGLATLTRGGEVLHANPALCAVLGRPESAAAGRLLAELIPSPELAASARAAARGAPEGPRVLRAEVGGAPRVLRASVLPMAAAGGERLLLVVEDLTDAERATERMRQAEKLTATGQLAAGIAHELNNPLGVILGFSQGLSRRLTGPDDPLRLPVDSIEREAKRCRDLVQDLLVFSRAQRAERLEPVDLCGAVAAAMALVKTRAALARVRVEERLEGTEALADPGRIQQVVVNLCNNAIDAMPGGGTLTVRLEPARAAGREEVVLTVSDTGTGIPDEVRARIFEPFFTTKEVGKGTGLGLSLVDEIVRKHDGRLELDTAAGRGTTFRVVLPAADGVKPAARTV